MASLLRQIVAGPRARHPEAGLDLCYVTDNIVATSGPSQAYPQRAYRNPLDKLVAFLDSKHDKNWAIWEFRAEGTGYPDSLVYGRIRHYPWPDHHPPPFRLVPMIMASMRNWLNGNDLDADGVGATDNKGNVLERVVDAWKDLKNGRVIVVHCKAGKGRSGTMACSFLISQCGWTPEQALARFTERRMRPKMGAGVSIPSQLRWISYVDRWTKGGKLYVDRELEIVEIHAWGLKSGVKVAVEGFVEEGKKIKVFHTFKKEEREIIEGDATTDGYADPGGKAVVFKPKEAIRLPTSDVNISLEKRNKTSNSMGLTMVTAVAHVWFNAFFEGNGPEQGGKPADSGVFEIEWDKLDGIKGSSQKGTQAADRIAVVWKSVMSIADAEEGSVRTEVIITEPGEDSPVPQMSPADWQGANEEDPSTGMTLGLRVRSPDSASVSMTSSIASIRGHENLAGGDGASDSESQHKLDAYADKLPDPEGTGGGKGKKKEKEKGKETEKEKDTSRSRP